jgi:hypothetical protein
MILGEADSHWPYPAFESSQLRNQFRANLPPEISDRRAFSARTVACRPFPLGGPDPWLFRARTVSGRCHHTHDWANLPVVLG